ncbi:MAG: heavy metal translocating P-type ATPase [Anaerolineae bacterium]|nr:heavy metal translocating P-type ATPase [Caldilineales bacterium]MCX7851546.1 heavy metal translocating P-type ATPase [Caldilineales bacterium]MDW8267685.1 heavy metal translocating P-type ATPase [Anaerolineae bacterium]
MPERVIDAPLILPPTDGEECATLLLETLKQHEGVRSAQIDFGRGVLHLHYDPDLIDLDTVDGIATDLGLRLGARMRRCTLELEGVNCRNCAFNLEQELAAIPGVHRITANPAARVVGVHYGDDAALAQLEKRIAELGYEVREAAPTTKAPSFWQRNIGLIWAGLTLVFLLTGVALERLSLAAAYPWLPILFFGLAYIAGGHDGLREAVRDLRHGVLNVDFLMITSAVGAAIIGEWAEGATLLFLFTLSGALEEYAMDRTRNAIQALTALRPTEATLRLGSRERRVPVEAVRPGDIVIIRPGEQIPVDGVVVAGQTSVNQAAITGESLPVSKMVGDEVFAGTLNQEGAIDVRCTKEAKDSTLAKVIALVAEAQSERAPTQRLIDRFAHPYALGVVTAVVLVIVIGVFGLRRPFEDVFYRAMTLLVVASPCALVISTPASILSAIAAGARHGVLFKGGVHLENTATLDTIAFDKTGTLTTGRPEVTDVLVFDAMPEDRFLQLVASAERKSEHPIARAIVRAAEARGLTLLEPTMFVSVPGQGVRAVVDGHELLIGNMRLYNSENGETANELPEAIGRLQADGKTTVLVFAGRRLLGCLAVADQVRANARETIQALYQAGIRRIVMLTGDHSAVARRIAAELQIDDVHAELLPADKVKVVKSYLDAGARTAMVGDGVNDAPALAMATVGIAMGAAGTDVALETADVVLMSDDLSKLPLALRLSRRSRRIIAQNMAFALAVMVVLVIATLTVGIPLPLGVVGHEGSTVVVVLNGLRLLRTR